MKFHNCYQATLYGLRMPLKCQLFFSCPDNWVDFDQSCFYFAEEVTPMTWYNAKYYCESHGAHLAEVPNNETQNFLANYAANIKPASWWLGGTDDKNVSISIMYNQTFL